jgi:hypothetical protein
MILVSKHIVPKGYTGITLFPFVFVKYAYLKNDKAFLNHERIHLRQQMELLILPFFIWYGIEFTLRFLQYKNWNLAYRNISFEREAYTNEKGPDYIKSRPFWSFLSYI